jgi:hypothetical protein
MILIQIGIYIKDRRLYFTIFFNLLFLYFPIFSLNCICCHLFSADNISVFTYNFIHIQFHVIYIKSYILPTNIPAENCLRNSLFRGDVTSSNKHESAIFRRWKSNLKWRMFHRLNDKGDNSLTEIPGCPEKRITEFQNINNAISVA